MYFLFVVSVEEKSYLLPLDSEVLCKRWMMLSVLFVSDACQLFKALPLYRHPHTL